MSERDLSPQNLVGNTEIADRLQVAPSTVHKWRQRYQTFPQPIRQLRSGLIYYWPDVVAWHRVDGPRAYGKEQ